MTYLTVIVPTHGRPGVVAEFVKCFFETRTYDTKLVFAIDDSDPTLPEYNAAVAAIELPYPVSIFTSPSTTMVEALNNAAVALYSTSRFLGFQGDDHRPRTLGWDTVYVDELLKLEAAYGYGMVYGNDLLQGPNIPTQIAMSSKFVSVLRHMALPTLRHLYVDNYWLSLGNELECVRYLPDVVVEHMHPAAGKADWDSHYARVNAAEVDNGDRFRFLQWDNDTKFEEVAKLQGFREIA